MKISDSVTVSSKVKFYNWLTETMCRDSLVGTATRYRLDGTGIESWWGGENFRTRPDRPWDPPKLL